MRNAVEGASFEAPSHPRAGAGGMTFAPAPHNAIDQGMEIGLVIGCSEASLQGMDAVPGVAGRYMTWQDAQ